MICQWLPFTGKISGTYHWEISAGRTFEDVGAIWKIQRKPPPGVWKIWKPAASWSHRRNKWQAEAEKLTTQKDLQYQQMKAMWEEIKAVKGLRKATGQLARSERTHKRMNTSYKHRNAAVQKNLIRALLPACSLFSDTNLPMTTILLR